MHWILPFDTPDVSLADAGGKGINLSRMARAGFPVPPGFIISTAAYRQFVADNDLQPRILAALESADPAQPSTLERASDHIHALFAIGQISPGIAEEIRAAYCAPHPTVRRACQVRSSSLKNRAAFFQASGRCRRRPLLRHRRGPARRELRGPAGDLPQRARRGRATRCGEAVLGQPVDGTRHRLPPPTRHCARRRQPGSGRPADGGRGCRRDSIHRQSRHRRARRGRHQRGVGFGRGHRRRAGDTGRDCGRQGQRRDQAADGRR